MSRGCRSGGRLSWISPGRVGGGPRESWSRRWGWRRRPMSPQPEPDRRRAASDAEPVHGQSGAIFSLCRPGCRTAEGNLMGKLTG
ncbi:hypothetical protein ADK96_31055 [Streptomyces sp. IGB124]|nr:hypothetical protein ADK96_31055 [Streptomyces sp. IGB124]